MPYQVPGVPGAPGTGYLLPGTWYRVPGARYLVPGDRYLALGTRYLVPGAQYQVPGRPSGPQQGFLLRLLTFEIRLATFESTPHISENKPVTFGATLSGPRTSVYI